MHGKLNVVIIEDNNDMAEFLRNLMESVGNIPYVSLTGLEGLSLIEKIKPELVLLDLQLPDVNGKTICSKVKSEYPDTKVIMITAENTSRAVVEGLDIGADDYVTKPLNDKELLARIRAQFRSSRLQQKELVVDDLVLDQETHQVTRGGQEIPLSAQEFTLLQYLMINKNKVLTRPMILSRIWDGNPDVSTRVVDVYIGYLRKKIDFKKPNLINTVRGFGYSIKDPAST